MTVIEQQTSGDGSNRSTNSATSTAHFFYFVNKIFGSLGHFHRQSLGIRVFFLGEVGRRGEQAKIMTTKIWKIIF